MKSKKKKKSSQTIFAGVEPVGNNMYELREWLGPKILAKGTIRQVFDRAEKLWPGHVRRRNGSPEKYMILERE